MEIIKTIGNDLHPIDQFASIIILHPLKFYKDGTCGWNNDVLRVAVDDYHPASGGYPRSYNWKIKLQNGMYLNAHSDGPIMDGKYDPFNVLTDGTTTIKNETIIYSDYCEYSNIYKYSFPINIAKELQDEYYKNGIIKVKSIHRIMDWDVDED